MRGYAKFPAKNNQPAEYWLKRQCDHHQQTFVWRR
jgi:hypothetical protein